MMELEHISTINNGDDCCKDLDLIDVLWRQDIDLGVSKEVFDVKLRRELERERELELQKKREKHKELELLRQKLKEEQRNQNQQWLTDHFTQDGETGEWIPLRQDTNISLQNPQDVAITEILSETQLTHFDENLSLQEALDFLNGEVGNYTFPETTNNSVYTSSQNVLPLQDPVPLQPDNSIDVQMLSPPHQPMMSPSQQSMMSPTQLLVMSPTQQLLMSPSQQSLDNLTSQQDSFYTNQTTVQPAIEGINRQESFEDRWQDLVTLLELPAQRQNVSNISMEVNTTDNVTLSPQNSNVLLHNVTLPVPIVTETNLTSLQPVTNETELLSPNQDYNASIPDVESMTDLECYTESLFLSNMSTVINQTDSLQDVDLLLDEDLDLVLNEGLETIQMLEDSTSSDSAISMGSASPFQEPQDSCSMSPYDGVEGATGGSSYNSPSYTKSSKYDGDDYHYNYNSYGYSRSESSPSNFSTSSNDTEFNKPNGGSQHIRHNHTYPAPPGMQPKEVKKYIKSDKPKHKGPAPKDAKRAAELKVPFTVDQITESPVEEFNEMITKHKLNDAQLQLVRDIRRRGKNKVAAQNCRKRKMDLVVTVEDELGSLKHQRDKLISERQLIDKQTREMKARFCLMYNEIFDSLRDEHGQPYDQNEYSLQQSSDGDVFLVPRNVSCNSDEQGKLKKRKNHKK